MERNQIIGFILIFATLMLWTITSAPSEEELAKSKATKDSLALIEEAKLPNNNFEAPKSTVNDTLLSDSLIQTEAVQKYGSFGLAMTGSEGVSKLENSLLTLEFNHKGGAISKAIMKQHVKTVTDSSGNETKASVVLLDSPKNKFDYEFVSKDGKIIKSSDLYFVPTNQGNSLSLRATIGENQYFEQVYTLSPDNYELTYSIKTVGLGTTLSNANKNLNLVWENHLPKLEKSEQFEQNYSTVYFKQSNERKDYCSCVSDDTKEVNNLPIQWVSNTNQFFNTSLITIDKPFIGGKFTTQKTDLKINDAVKVTTANVQIPIENFDNGSFDMKIYVGPNEFKRLSAYNNDINEIIPFGSSIFGTINRWVIRPFFDFLSNYIGSKGLVIILLIFLIKMLLYPLMYKMLYSQAKMGALKPELAHLKEKYKDDMQKQQMETMKIYREYGVSPLGGCLPMLLQMPIWYALFRFFPASITFRQEPFLWANDLSTYDVLFLLPFEIPFFGAHVSLFTLLWAVSTIVYTYYNMQNMDLSANPAMKYVQYIMPILFLAFFNNYASGLTCYMFFSNLINVAQTVITKNYIFDEKKIREQLMIEKSKPKKKGGFQAKLEEAMKQQQLKQDERKRNKK